MHCSSSNSKRTALAAVLGVFASISSVSAKRTCDTSLGTFYPYCVNVPDDVSDGEKLPTVLFLQGRGARGDASQVKTLSTYDGFGKLVNEYESGNTDEAHTIAATKFISIVPVAPTNTNNGLDPQYWYPELLDKVVDAVIAKYPVDTNRFHVAGYSMGAFGSWRYAVHRPELIASIVPSGGNAEQNSITNSLGQTVPAVMSQLSSVDTIPVRAFAGSQDTTVPPAGAEQTQQKMESLGDTKSTLTILNTDHSGLSVGPFTADLLNWMLQQKRSGGSSSSSTTNTSSSSSDESSTSSSSGSSDSTSGSTDTPSSPSSGSSSSSSSKVASGSSTSSDSSSSSSKKKCTRRRKRSLRSPASHAEQRRSLSLAKILADRQSVKAL